MVSVTKLLAIVAGCLLIASGIDFFLMPIKVLDGGIIGIALIVNYLFEVKVGTFLFASSIPVFAYAWFRDRTTLIYSLYGMLLLSLFINMLEPFTSDFVNKIHLNPFVSSTIGGLIIGIGFGVLLRNNTSTGGLDLLAMLLTDNRRLNVGILLWVIDAIIVSIGGLLFNADTFFLSVATVCSGGIATSLCTAIVMKDAAK